MLLLFFFCSSKHFSKREEAELKYHKIWIYKKSVESFGAKKIFSSVLQLAGETCEINFEQQTKIQIFYFQELWWYVVLFLWGGEYIYNW